MVRARPGSASSRLSAPWGLGGDAFGLPRHPSWPPRVAVSTARSRNSDSNVLWSVRVPGGRHPWRLMASARWAGAGHYGAARDACGARVHCSKAPGNGRRGDSVKARLLLVRVRRRGVGQKKARWARHGPAHCRAPAGARSTPCSGASTSAGTSSGSWTRWPAAPLPGPETAGFGSLSGHRAHIKAP